MFSRSIPAALLANSVQTFETLLPDGPVELDLSATLSLLPEGDPGAWGTAFIFEGQVSLGDAAQRIITPGRLDCLLVIPAYTTAGPVRLDPNITTVTFYYPGGQDHAVIQARIRQTGLTRWLPI